MAYYGDSIEMDGQLFTVTTITTLSLSGSTVIHTAREEERHRKNRI